MALSSLGGVAPFDDHPQEDWIHFVLAGSGEWEGARCIAHFDDGSTLEATLDCHNAAAFSNVSGKSCQRFEMSFQDASISGSVTDAILSTILR